MQQSSNSEEMKSSDSQMTGVVEADSGLAGASSSPADAQDENMSPPQLDAGQALATNADLSPSPNSSNDDGGCCATRLVGMLGGRQNAGRKVTDGSTSTEGMMLSPPSLAAERSIKDEDMEEPRTEEKPRTVSFIKHKGAQACDHYEVDGHTVGSMIKEIFRKEIENDPHHDFSCIWNLISNFARFDFEWRVSSPQSWKIEDNMVKREMGPLDTNQTKYAAVTLNFDTEVVDEMELCFKLRTQTDLNDGNAIFLGVLNDRTTDSFACIGKSGFITIRTTRNQQSNASKWLPFNDGEIFGIRVRIPNKIQFNVNNQWSPVYTFHVGKLTTIYLSVRPIMFEAEVISLKMKQRKEFKLGKMPFRLRNVWPPGADREI